jgi:hypothetical protein
MSDTANAKCDRCGADTGRPCRREGDLALPKELEVRSPVIGEPAYTKIRFLQHLHLCATCLSSLQQWFEDGSRSSGGGPGSGWPKGGCSNVPVVPG